MTWKLHWPLYRATELRAAFAGALWVTRWRLRWPVSIERERSGPSVSDLIRR